VDRPGLQPKMGSRNAGYTAALLLLSAAFAPARGFLSGSATGKLLAPAARSGAVACPLLLHSRRRRSRAVARCAEPDSAAALREAMSLREQNLISDQVRPVALSAGGHAKRKSSVY